MKNIIIKTGTLVGIAITLLLSSCDEFLGTIPKGEKIPQTFQDYNAFISYEENHYFDNMQQMYLQNDIYGTAGRLSSYELLRINYMWDESANRYIEDNYIQLSSNTPTYSYCYQGIAHWNLIINNIDGVTEASQQQKEQLKAQAKVLRAMAYFHLTNYYADQYTPNNAETSLTVPLVQSANVESASPQASQKEMYEFILSNLTESSIEALPAKGETVFHPTKTAGYGMLARVHLQIGNYDNALKYAQKALDINDKLYDWRKYYEENGVRYDTNTLYARISSEITLTNPESYVYAHSSMQSYQGYFYIPIERASQYDPKDIRLLTRWRYREYSDGNRYIPIISDKINGGGISSPEMYYIKAECLARNNQVQDAMNTLNNVRETRFLAEGYTPLSASSIKQAVKYICQDKSNEFIQTAIPFWDNRRLNKDPEYASTLTKTVSGVAYTLKPDSHLWIMPFSEKVMTNPGNNPIKQNTPR